jgi:hypothetical protein
VAEVNEREVIVPFVDVRFVIPPFVANNFVDVVFVPVALTHVMPEMASGAVSVRFVIVAFVAPKLVANPFVVVALVEVTLVNTPVEGVAAPIVVPLIDPPEIVTFDEMSVGAVNVLTVPERAFNVVPVAVVKLKKLVDVPFVNERFVIVPFVEFNVVAVPFVVKKFVVVAFEPRELVKKIEAIVPLATERLEPVADTNESEVMDAFVAPLFVAKLFVEVTFVPVAFVNVTPWREALLPIVRVPTTARSDVIANAAVDVPPANWIAFVVVFPALVTVWKLGDVPDGQFVPLARQTF